MSYIMLNRTLFVLSVYLMTLTACDSNDQSFQEDLVNLPFTSDNLEGDWKRTAQFIGQANDSLGILEPKEDLFAQFDVCRKDDIIRYEKGSPQEENNYFWGIGEAACHSQIANSFLEIGAWNIEKSGKLTHSYSDVSEPFIVVILRSRQLLVRKKPRIIGLDRAAFEFTKYERIK